MKSLIVIALLIYGSWHFTELTSDSAWESVVAPIILFFSLMALGFWLVLVAGLSGRADGYGGGDSSGFGGVFGDGGGGGD